MVAMNVGERLAEREAENRLLRDQLAAALAEVTALRAQLALLQAQVVAGNQRGGSGGRGRSSKARRASSPTFGGGTASFGLVSFGFAFCRFTMARSSSMRSLAFATSTSSATGRTGLSETLPTDESTLFPDRCDCGCSDFEWVDEVVEEKLQISAHVRRKVTHRKTGRCKKCVTDQPSREAAPP